MSSDEIAIRVSNLSKCYEIYDTPRDRLKQFVLPRAQRFAGGAPRQYFREFWALNDVSFEIRRGETVGVIGRNGSGKSTLLQMICGTLTPTSGSIETSGRIAALLELGSGFNPEFTGRENIYLNASVLGLTIEEIDARYADIVAFADIGQFVEQPVKTYSSGMYLRLAFAVIAHVDADILVVDEALAVGDAVFTQKCMRFIRKFQERGTLIFVSHDTASVQNLCRSGIWLKHGRVEQLGTAKAVSEAYLQYTMQEIYGAESKLTSIGTGADTADGDIAAPETASGYGAQAAVQDNLSDANGWKTGHADIVSVTLTRLCGNPDVVFEGDEPVRMTVRARAHQALERPILGFLVRDRLGQDLFGENTLHFTGLRPTPVAAGALFEGVFEFRLPMLPNGQYAVMASVADGDLQNHVQHHWLHDALIVNISSSKIRYGLVGLPFTRAELEVIHE